MSKILDSAPRMSTVFMVIYGSDTIHVSRVVQQKEHSTSKKTTHFPVHIPSSLLKILIEVKSG
jgi:hypothetical protein